MLERAKLAPLPERQARDGGAPTTATPWPSIR